MTATWLSKTKNSFRIAVQVSPNARKSEIASAKGDVLRIRLQAQPVDGKANEALIQFIAKKTSYSTQKHRHHTRPFKQTQTA
ncbi:DUF167 domain-containing protein [Oxalobacter aliiformigenes]|uniref:DUF167 domain-containing protein n=1 Tax=Oxalobacter aliiformigenes TaxID=2946593 RepID=A0A9E9LEW4_9BURK|nr:DUF167 domain-containing protein [Oxalobacter aliiformigenes]WAV91414.1 DUF167 domain-containing protein [Oxalobacter aliiformigenes]